LRIEKKRRQKEQKEEDKLRLAKAKMRSKKLQNLEKLTEENPQAVLFPIFHFTHFFLKLKFMLKDKEENNPLFVKGKVIEDKAPEQPPDVLDSDNEEPG
jgi:hypothetical protein